MLKDKRKGRERKKERIILGKCVCPPLHVCRQTSKQTRQIRIKLAAQTEKGIGFTEQNSHLYILSLILH